MCRYIQIESGCKQRWWERLWEIKQLSCRVENQREQPKDTKIGTFLNSSDQILNPPLIRGGGDKTKKPKHCHLIYHTVTVHVNKTWHIASQYMEGKKIALLISSFEFDISQNWNSACWEEQQKKSSRTHIFHIMAANISFTFILMLKDSFWHLLCCARSEQEQKNACPCFPLKQREDSIYCR